MKRYWALCVAALCLPVGPFYFAQNVHSGDLGFFDSYLSGVRTTSTPAKFVFDIYGDIITFAPGRLDVMIGNRSKKVIAKLAKRNPFFDSSAALKSGWISPSQVDAYDYHVQHGAGVIFKLYYRGKNGEMSLATFAFRDENTAMSFHNTMLDWINNKLPDGSAFLANP